MWLPCANVDWIPTTSGPVRSSFAAVLAGFVFACLVTVITRDRRRNDTGTIRLFVAAFLCLVADSYVGTLVASDPMCQRALAESSVFNSLLSLGTVAIFSGLAWLVSSSTTAPRGDPFYDVEQFIVRLTYAVAVVAIILLEASSRGHLLGAVGDQFPDTWYGWTLNLYAPVVVVLLVGLRLAVLRGRRKDLVRGETRLRIAAVSTCVAVVLEILLATALDDIPRDSWFGPATWTIGVSTVAPPLLAAGPIIAMVCALPARIRPEPSNP